MTLVWKDVQKYVRILHYVANCLYKVDPSIYLSNCTYDDTVKFYLTTCTVHEHLQLQFDKLEFHAKH